MNCPACYNLVQDDANKHLVKLQEFEKKLNEINTSAVVISDEEFEDKLKEVQFAVKDLLNQARVATGGDDKSVLERLNDIRDRQRQVSKILDEVEDNILIAEKTGLQGLRNVTEAGNIIEEARKELNVSISSYSKSDKNKYDFPL